MVAFAIVAERHIGGASRRPSAPYEMARFVTACAMTLVIAARLI